jgi:glycosyltransferase involved in cell wall biosynthesis
VKKKRVLVISQTFVPDPASVGQHMADVAIELARRGYDVRVYASGRGYEDSSVKYPRRENLNGVDVRRLPLGSFGKRNLLIRVLGTASFLTQAFLVQLFTPRVSGIFFSTSPPLVGISSCIVKLIRRVPIAYWAMDLNPDQLITMGKVKEKGLVARVLEAGNRAILKRSSLIIALDRFMAGRLLKRGNYQKKMLIMPPWSHEDHMQEVDQGTNPFRLQHGLVGKRVIMYSGNHSPANPLATLLKVALTFKDDDRVRFLFVGGGTGKREVEACIAEHRPANIISLPYQPLENLKYSLPAADVHAVTMGQDMVGIIHPCKIYGAMAVQRPILYFGPSPSHISDLLDTHDVGWHVNHGDVEGGRRVVEQILAMPLEQLREMGSHAKVVLHRSLSQRSLCAKLVDQLEETFQLR